MQGLPVKQECVEHDERKHAGQHGMWVEAEKCGACDSRH